MDARSIARIRTVRTCALWTDRTEPARLPVPMGSRTPVLIVVGEYDVSAPPEDGRWIASLLGNATLVEMPAQGHADAAGGHFVCGGAAGQPFRDAMVSTAASAIELLDPVFGEQQVVQRPVPVR